MDDATTPPQRDAARRTATDVACNRLFLCSLALVVVGLFTSHVVTLVGFGLAFIGVPLVAALGVRAWPRGRRRRRG